MKRFGNYMQKSFFTLIFCFMLASCGDDVDLPGERLSPSIADDGDFMYRVWVDTRNGGADVFFARSEDEGDNWTFERKLNRSIDISIGRRTPKVTVNEATGYIYVIWEEDKRTSGTDIIFIASPDRGVNWDEQQRVNIDDSETVKTHPAIDVDNNTVFVVWEDYRTSLTAPKIFANRTKDNGQSWLSDDDLIDPVAVTSQKNPSVAILSGSAVLVAWEQESSDLTNDIKASVNTGELTNDGLPRWSEAFLINDITANDQSAPDLVPAFNETGGRTSQAFIVWQDSAGGTYDINFALLDTTASTSAEFVLKRVKITDAPGNELRPVIGNSGMVNQANVLYVAWIDNRNGNLDVFFSKSLDNGVNWQIDERGDTDSGGSSIQTLPEIESDINLVPEIIWEDYRTSRARIFNREL